VRLASVVVAIGCAGAVLGWLTPTVKAAEVVPAALPSIVFAFPCGGGAGHQANRRSVHIGAFAVHAHVGGGLGQSVSGGFSLVLDPARLKRSHAVSALRPRAERCATRPRFADLTPDDL
jgi:hypothetical protein